MITKPFFLCIITLFVSAVSFAQAQTEPLPPPPPLIFKAPAETELKKFVSSDYGFEAVFAGEPVLRGTEMGPQKIYAFSSYKNGSHLVVQISKYSNQKSVSDYYAEMRTKILSYPDASIESEFDVKLGGISGKEFAVLTGYVYHRIRLFFNGNTLYTVGIDATNWQILKGMRNDKAAEFQKEADRFFDSFKLTR